jgi:hypothetical protein
MHSNVCATQTKWFKATNLGSGKLITDCEVSEDRKPIGRIKLLADAYSLIEIGEQRLVNVFGPIVLKKSL